MEMPKEEQTVEKKQTWKNPFSGEIYDNPLDISYYKNQQREEIINNSLLGNFTSEGNYQIEKSILNELINVNKFIYDTVEGSYALSAKVKADSSFDLEFILTILKDEENNKKIAVLKLVETYISLDGSNINTIKTIIAKYKDEDDIYFLQKVAKVFHIVDKRDYDGKDAENDEILIEILKLKKNYKIWKVKYSETNEYLSKFYLDKLIATLKNSPCEYSSYLLRKYEEVLTKFKDKVNTANYYKLLRLELDKHIKASTHKCDNPDLLKKLNHCREEFLSAHQNFEDSLVFVPPKKEEAKADAPATKKAAASASSAAKKTVTKKAKGPAPKKAEPAKPTQFFEDLTKKKKQNIIEFTVTTPEKPKTKKPLDPLAFANMLSHVTDGVMSSYKMLSSLKNEHISGLDFSQDILNTSPSPTPSAPVEVVSASTTITTHETLVL